VPLARRVRAVGFRILRARAAEEPLPLTAAMQLVAVLDGVAALVAHDLHALVVRPALNLDELALLEPHEAGMQEIEGHGEAAHAAGREPLVAHPDVRLEADAARVELSVQLVDAVADPGTVEGDAEVPQLDLQEALVGPTGPGEAVWHRSAQTDGGEPSDAGDHQTASESDVKEKSRALMAGK